MEVCSLVGPPKLTLLPAITVAWGKWQKIRMDIIRILQIDIFQFCIEV